MKAFVLALTVIVAGQAPDFYRPPPQEPQVFIVLRIDQPENDTARILIRAYERFEDCRAVADDIEEANPAEHRFQFCEAVLIQKAHP